MLLCFVIAGLQLRENVTEGTAETLVFITFPLFCCISVIFINTCSMRFRRVFIVFWKGLVKRDVFLTDPSKRGVRHNRRTPEITYLG